MPPRVPASEFMDEFRPPSLDTGFKGVDFPETSLDAGEFADLIESRGVGCMLRRAVRCPCQRIETRQPRMGCPTCKGLGYAYPEELTTPTVAIVQSRSARRQNMGSGQQVTGTCSVTFLPGIIPAQGDQIIPDGDEHAVQQVLRRSVAQVVPEVVRGRATAPEHLAPVIRATTEALLYPDVTRVEALHWLDGEGRLRMGIEGRDYRRVDNVIEFLGDSGPAPGTAYTIRYRAPAVYVLSPAEPVARTAELDFPYKCEAQRLDRWGEGDLR